MPGAATSPSAPSGALSFPSRLIARHGTPVESMGARMALHYPDEVGVGWGLRLVFGDFLDAVDEASTRDTVEQGLGIRRTKLEVGDDVGLTDPHRKPLRPC